MAAARWVGAAVRAAVRWIVRVAWLYLLIPVFLTGLFAAVGRLGPGEIAMQFAFNFTVVVAIGGTIEVLHHVWRPDTKGWSPWRRWGWVALSVAIGLVVGTEIAIRSFAAVLGIDDPSIMRRQVLSVGVWVAAIATIVSIYVEIQKDRREALDQRRVEAEREALRAQLRALQARTDPHFLFNALNTVASLIEEDPAKAERAVERLADLYRYTLEGAAGEEVPLHRELEAVRDYVAIQRLRFEDRLVVEFEIDPDVGDTTVVPLSLQPLVENAIKHGIASSPAGGTVVVTARIEGDSVVIGVDDDGPGPGGSSRRGTGAGHTDLRRRLELRYGPRAGLDVGARPGGGYRARVRLPRVAEAPA